MRFFKPLVVALPVLAFGLVFAGGQKETPKAWPKNEARSTELLDINTASIDQLKALKGIGDAYAAKIVKGRPYKAKNELVQRGIIPEATYEAIREQIIAKQK
jgi:DNA uptake protein ComE-like DNA-binding protein